MESENKSQTAANELAELRKAQAKIHTRYPKLGWWYPPLYGLAFSVFVASQAASSWVTIVGSLGFIAVMITYINWCVKKRGVFPTYKDAPSRIKREMTTFYFFYGVGILAVVATYRFVSWQAATLTTFVLATMLTAIYEHRYAEAAQKTEQEMGMRL